MMKKMDADVVKGIELPEPSTPTQEQETEPVKTEDQVSVQTKEQVPAEPVDEREELIRRTIEAVRRQEEEKRLLEYQRTPQSSFDKFIQDQELPEQVRQAIKSEADKYLKHNPEATREDAEKWGNYMKNRFMEVHQEETRMKEDNRLYKGGWLHSKYGETSIDIMNALKNSMIDNFGYSEDMVEEYISNWTPEQLKTRVEKFYQENYINQGKEARGTVRMSKQQAEREAREKETARFLFSKILSS